MSLFRKKKSNPQTIPSVDNSTESKPSAKVSLKKAEDGLNRSIVRLTKKIGIDLGTHKARVFVVMDRSGSMQHLYTSGAVQDVLTRLLPLALRFDDNGELEVYVFNEDCDQMPSMNLQNYENYVQEMILSRNYGPGGGTNYAPIIKQTIKNYNDGCPDPAFGIVITDGENWDPDETDKAVRKSSKHRIFYQFVGIGRENFKYLQKLDNLDGRKVDNTAFIKVSDISKLDDDQLYDKLLEQYPQWLEAMGIN